MPLAIPATLRTIDMRPVYDGRWERIMKHSIVCTVIFQSALGLCPLAAQAQNQQPSMPMGQSSMPMGQMGEMHKPAPPAGPLEIQFGGKTATSTPATLANLPHVTVTVHNEHTKADDTYSGVPLMDLLTPLGVPAARTARQCGSIWWPKAPTDTKRCTLWPR